MQVQKYLERWLAENDRRHRIFKTLMATRAARLAPNHIEALNMINIEFPANHKWYKKVRSAWKAYFTQLGEKNPEDTQLQAVHFAKRNELFTDLLYETGTALDYDFDQTDISKEIYSTVHQENLEVEAQTIRTELVEILTGKGALPMAVVQFPSDPEAIANQAEYLKMMTEYLRQGKPLAVTIVGDASAGRIVPMRPTDTHGEGKTG